MQAFHFLTLGCGVALDYSLVALVGDFLTDVVLVVGDKDTFAVATVFGVELHGGVESGTGACEEVEDGQRLIMWIGYF